MRQLNGNLVRAVLLGLFGTLQAGAIGAEDPISIGSRRELFVDEALVGSLSGEAWHR